jgi:phage shock protein B
MQGVLIVTVVFVGTILALAVIGGTILMAIKLLKGGVSRKDQSHMAEEAKMVQEIYQGLSQLEERLESLETILFERDKKEHRR